MASRTEMVSLLLTACWLFLQISWARAQNSSCPTIDSIFPPSGTVQVSRFSVRGSNLTELREIIVDLGTPLTIAVANITLNETYLEFVINRPLLVIGSEGARPVTFVAANRTQLCANQVFQLYLLDGE